MIKYFSIFLVLISISYFGIDSYNKKSNAQKKSELKKDLNIAINLRKNKREKSIEYKFLQDKDVSGLVKHLGTLKENKVEGAFKNLLISRFLISELGALDKNTLLSFLLSDIYSKNQKIRVYKSRLLPYFLKNNKDSFVDVSISKYLSNNKVNIEEKAVLLDEMKSWAKIPALAFEHIKLNLDHEPGTRAKEIGLIQFNNVNDTVYKRKLLDHILSDGLDQLTEKEKNIFYTSSLSQADQLGLRSVFFEDMLSFGGPNWDQLKLDYILKFSLHNKHKKIVRSIAGSSNNFWIKQKAKKIMEKL